MHTRLIGMRGRDRETRSEFRQRGQVHLTIQKCPIPESVAQKKRVGAVTISPGAKWRYRLLGARTVGDPQCFLYLRGLPSSRPPENGTEAMLDAYVIGMTIIVNSSLSGYSGPL